ncbi:MAG: hypothetical protein KatS3mg019_0296 [Fimbriimonadales bacterium]|nr:MAG: hypothetical protein KatS3mg019_0296 [Fimbriimonadales bacterium]
MLRNVLYFGGLCVLWLVGFSSAYAFFRDDPLPQDARLEQRVSLRLGATPLKTLLKNLSQQTGVSLRVEGAIGEHRAFVRWTNRPLNEAMRTLAEAFGFKWRVEQDQPDNSPRYVLYQSPDATQQQNLARDALQDGIPTALQRAVQSIPEDLMQMSYEEFCEAVGAIPDFVLAEKFLEAATQGAEGAPEITPPLPKPRYAPLLDPLSAPVQEMNELLAFSIRRALLMEAAQDSGKWATLHLLRNAPPNFWESFRRTNRAMLAPTALPIAVRNAYEQAYQRTQKAQDEYAASYSGKAPSPSPIPEEGMHDETAFADEFPDELLESAWDKDILTIIYQPDLAQIRILWCDGEERFAEGTLYLLSTLMETLNPKRVPEDDALKKAFETASYRLKPIEDRDWNASMRDRWENWLSYAIVEGLESAGLDGVGEFYPVSSEQFTGAAVSPSISNLQELLSAMHCLYAIRVDSGCVIFQARARVLARLTDIPDYRLTRWTKIAELTLEWAADAAVSLSQQQAQGLLNQLSGFNSYMEATQRQQNDSPNLQIAFELFLMFGRYHAELRWYGRLPLYIHKRLQQGASIAFTELPPQARIELKDLLMRDFIPCLKVPVDDLKEYIFECRNLSIQLKQQVEQTAREYDIPNEPASFARYTEKRREWHFQLRGNDCPRANDTTAGFSIVGVVDRNYEVLERRDR